MKTMLTTVVAATLVLGTGCTIENEASITILRALSVEDDCIADVGLNGQSRGLFDVSYQNADYFQAFHARNNMPPNDDESILQVDTNIFLLERTLVNYREAPEDPDASGVLAGIEFVSSLSGEISSGEDQGFFVNLIPARQATLLRDSLVPSPGDRKVILTAFRVEGHTTDGYGTYGKAMTTGTYVFPIVICNGCVTCPAGDVFACGPGQYPCVTPDSP